MIEAILVSGLISQFLIPALGVIITGLVGWGVTVLKKKTDSDLAKNALDEVDRIVGTVVGNLAQTTAKDMKAASKDGHLTREEKATLKTKALSRVENLISTNAALVAQRSVESLRIYAQNKIEERVLAGKK